MNAEPLAASCARNGCHYAVAEGLIRQNVAEIERLEKLLDAERQRAEELQALLKDYERRLAAVAGADTPTLAEG